jgi:hypothetical protein
VRNNLETAKDCKVKNIHEIQTLVSEIVYSDVRFYIIVSRMFNVISCVKDMKLKSVNKLDKSKVGYTIQM